MTQHSIKQQGKSESSLGKQNVRQKIRKVGEFFGLMKTPERLVLNGNAKYDSGRYLDAFSMYLEAEKMGHPIDCETCKRCGDISRKNKDYDAALTYYEMALEKVKKSVSDLSNRMGKLYLHNEIYETLVRNEGAIDASFIARKLRNYPESEDIREFFERMRTASNMMHELLRKIGKTYYLMDHHKKAMNALDSALLILANDDEIAENYGQNYMARFYSKLGKTAMKHDEHAHAVLYFGKAVSIEHGNPEYQYLLSQAQYFLEDGNVYSAIGAALKAEVFGKTEPKYRKWLGDLYLKLSENVDGRKNSLDHLKQVAEYQEAAFGRYAKAVALYEKKGLGKEAEDLEKLARELKANVKNNYLKAAEICKKNGYREAEELESRARQIED